MKKHYRQENNCLNCGTILEGKFCHNCGQENLEIKESFGHMMNHAISDYFHFDHQFFHTIKPLLFKPGYLTNEYMAGRRAQYLHPVKMYIFISIVYFLLVFQSGAKVVNVNNTPAKVTSTKAALDSAKKAIEADDSMTPAEKKQAIGYVEYGKNFKKIAGSKLFIVSGDSTLRGYDADQKKLSEKDRDGVVSRIFAEKFLGYNEKYGSQAREQFVEDIQHNIPKMMFVLLPLFALMLTVTFRKNKKFYVEHLIYTFHLHCFIFLFTAMVLIVEMALPAAWKISQWLSLLAVIYVFWYFYRSLRVVYQRSRFRTITKLIGISLLDGVALMVCMVLLVFITALL
jgi:hypothetical protein